MIYLDIIYIELLAKIITYLQDVKDIKILISLVKNKKIKSDKIWESIYKIKCIKLYNLIINLRNLNDKISSLRWYNIYIETLKLYRKYSENIDKGNLIYNKNTILDSCSVNDDMLYLINVNDLNTIYPLMVKKLNILPDLNVSVEFLLKNNRNNVINIHYKKTGYLLDNIDLNNFDICEIDIAIFWLILNDYSLKDDIIIKYLYILRKNEYIYLDKYWILFENIILYNIIKKLSPSGLLFLLDKKNINSFGIVYHQTYIKYINELLSREYDLLS